MKVLKMMQSSISGKAQTVTGLIDGSELGITLPHEHLFIDMRFRMPEPADSEEAKLAHQKITMENLWFARYNRFSVEDNLLFDDEAMAISEAMYFKKAGGSTIVDVTSNNIGRQPESLVRVSRATGLNIIMGTGYYIAPSYTPEMVSKTEEEIADEFIREVTTGVGNTGIKAGIIGEIGMSWPIAAEERKALRAAGIAQQETSAAVNVHPGIYGDAPFECVKILEEVGADLSRVVISHVERSLPIGARSTRAKLAEKGCYLEIDLFGTDVVRFHPDMFPYDVPNDAIRVNEVMELIADGFLDQVLISQDVCFKVLLRKYGGGGYSHILKFVLPRMRSKGMTEEQINTILVENPRRINTFV
ncbi:MAG: phosphotriesterase [Dehalococcoidales bacterium]